jgi:putative sterol carrier protein
MEIQTPQEFFEKQLPERFKPEKATGINAVAQLTLTGPDGGEWVIIIKDQKLQVKEGKDPAATVTLKASDRDFMDMVNEKLSVEKAFFTGRIHFKGDLALALKLRDTGFL